jgi:hypothetical protein
VDVHTVNNLADPAVSAMAATVMSPAVARTLVPVFAVGAVASDQSAVESTALAAVSGALQVDRNLSGSHEQQQPVSQRVHRDDPNDPDDPGRGGRYRERGLRALERRAIAGRWPVPEKMREEIIDNLGKIATGKDQDAGPREAVAAGKAVIAADALNMEQEKRDGGIPDRLELTGPNGEAIQLEHGSAGPVSDAARLAAVMALLERARARALADAPQAAAVDEVHPALPAPTPA